METLKALILTLLLTTGEITSQLLPPATTSPAPTSGIDPTLNRKHLIAYNCAIKDTLQYTEFSLMEVANCANVSSQYRSSYTIKGQVIQPKTYEDLTVTECKLRASFYVAYCSYNLLSGYRLWDSRGEIMNVYIQLSASECQNALKTKTLKYTDRTYYSKQNFLSIDLSPSFTAEGWMTLRGSSDSSKGTCVPESFQLGRHLYKSHVLTMEYSVIIRQVHAVFNTVKRLIRIDDHLILPNTLTGSYFSPTEGNYHWEPIPQGNLTDNHWLEITKGDVTIHVPRNINTSMPIAIIMATESRASIAFSLRERTNLCLFSSCRGAYKTQLKDVYLVIYQNTGESHWPFDRVSGSEMNRLLNLEASFASIYLTQEMRLTATFDRISRELCQRNRETILNNIHDYISKVLIQQDTQGSPGRYFVRAGSVLYSIKCVEQIAWLRGNTTKCYDYAPIYYNNKNNEVVAAFVDPINYIIKPESSTRKCNDILPYKLKIMALDGSSEWICRTSTGWRIDCKAPQVLSPMHPKTLYTADDDSIMSSLYTDEQLDSLTDMQWQSSEEEVNMNEWEIYLQKVKTNNPTISTETYFEHIKASIDSISDIFSSSYWIKMLMKHMLPLVFLNYIVNCLLNMLKALIYIKGVHQRDGCSLSLLSRGCLAIVASLFPVFALSVFNTKPPAPVKICPCEEDNFVDTLIREIEKKERQRFLRNLQL